MSKRIVSSVIGVMVMCVWFPAPRNCFAFRLLTKEKALEKVFGAECEIVTESKELSGPALDNVKGKLGGKLTDYQKGSKSEEVEPQTSIEFCFAVKDGEKVGVAVFDEEPGKWGPVEFIVGLDLAGAVTRVEVLSYKEKRGRPIARRSFMGQFEGKTGRDPFEVRKDIHGISGATISSRCAAFAVKKAVLLYEEFYLGE